MPTNSVNFADSREPRGATHHRPRASRDAHPPRQPSAAGYLAAAGVVAFALFFAVWWLLTVSGDDSPWLPAILGASVVMLLAVATREVVMRRAWSRYMQELEWEMGRDKSTVARPGTSSRSRRKVSLHSTAGVLRALLRQLAQADEVGAQRVEAHLEAFRLCEQYLANSEETLNSPRLAPDVRIAMRSGQERVLALRRHHLLAWARAEAQRLTHEAQRRVSVSDRIETALRALDVINDALRHYPGEVELRESAQAVRDFIASVKIGHWVELAERAAFRGRHARAIARYHDALFYLSRAEISEDARREAAARINCQIDMLREVAKTNKVAAGKERPSDETSAEQVVNLGEGPE
ncbi:MAG: hypothetical protein M3Q76_08945 [Acidobacteriota bacterium]|nr:hypothetical protein [Acidobacteriota bacterium]